MTGRPDYDMHRVSSFTVMQSLYAQKQISDNFGVFSRGSWKFSAILTESVCKHLADNKIVALATFSFDNPVGKQHPEAVSHRSRASFSYSLTLVRWINPLWVSGLETAAMAETH